MLFMWHLLTLKVLCSKVIQISHKYIYKSVLSQVYMYACVCTHTQITYMRTKLNPWLPKVVHELPASFFSSNFCQLCNTS